MTHLACLLCGFYLELAGGALVQSPLEAYQGAIPFGEFRRFDRNEIRNPYGSLAIGLEYSPPKLPQLEFSAEIRHTSAPLVRDKGEDGAWVRVRYLPFRRP